MDGRHPRASAGTEPGVQIDSSVPSLVRLSDSGAAELAAHLETCPAIRVTLPWEDADNAERMSVDLVFTSTRRAAINGIIREWLMTYASVPGSFNAVVARVGPALLPRRRRRPADRIHTVHGTGNE